MQAAQPLYTQFAEDNMVGELSRGSRLDFVPAPEEVAYSFIDVIVDLTIAHEARAVAEVVGPAT